MRKTLVIITSFLLLGTFAMPAFAQSADTVTAQVDRTNLSTDEVMRLTISVNATGGTASRPTLPALDGFNVIGSSSSTQISLINGDMSIKEVYQYQLRPAWAGDLVIPPVTATVNGRTFSTDPIAISVTQGTGQLQPAPNRAAPAFPSIPNFPSFPSLPSNPTSPNSQVVPVDPASPPTTELVGQEYFVEATVDNPTPHQGEQVIYTFRFYQAADGFGLRSQPEYQGPTFTGFWHDQEPQQGEYTVQAAGRTYRVTQMQTVLFPTVVGEVIIDPATLNMPGGFFSRGQVLRTQPISINVQPLPPNAPAGFQGAVGQFNIQAEADKTATTVNDTVTMRVTLSGQGNIDTLPDPEWPDSPEWRAFDSQATNNTGFQNGKWGGSRVLSRVLVPTMAGNLTLPAIQFSYFDPQSSSYQTVSTQPIAVSVSPDGSASAPTFPAANNGAASSVPSVMGLRSVKPAPVTWAQGTPPLTDRAGYWLLWAVPAALVLGHLGWQFRKNRRLSNPAARRSEKAAKRAKQALRQASNNPAHAYNTAGQILTDYIADKLDRPITGLTQTDLSQVLLSRGIEPALVERVQTCLMFSEMGRYAPDSALSGSGDILDATSRLIEELEKAFLRS